MKTALAFYFPVIHKGYYDFIEDHPKGPIYILSEEVIQEVSKFDEENSRSVARDMRRLSSISLAKCICKISSRTNFVAPIGLNEIHYLKQVDLVVIPDDSFHRAFAKRFKDELPKVRFENCFLRWDRMHTLNKETDVTGEVVTAAELKDLGLFRFVEQAESETSKSPDWWRQVGAVLVRDEEQILTAFNQHLPSEYETYFSGDPRANFNAGEYIELSTAVHAEASLIALAAKKGIATEGCELFVTTFPCPPCAMSVAVSGIKRIFFVEGYSMINSVKIFEEFGVEVIKVLK
jgi:dCMP deaminase